MTSGTFSPEDMIADRFKKFETASQLFSYVGITPTIRKPGNSLRGRSRVSIWE